MFTCKLLKKNFLWNYLVNLKKKQACLQRPGISSRLEIPLSTKSISGLLISLASSITFLAFDIFPVFGIQETGGW